MKWTDQAVSSLTIRDGYRLRGENMTSIEVFSDAAFAFAVTMLVISNNEIPRSYDELLTAMKGIPSFAASFAVIMVVWVAHRQMESKVWIGRWCLNNPLTSTCFCGPCLCLSTENNHGPYVLWFLEPVVSHEVSDF